MTDQETTETEAAKPEEKTKTTPMLGYMIIVVLGGGFIYQLIANQIVDKTLAILLTFAALTVMGHSVDQISKMLGGGK